MSKASNPTRQRQREDTAGLELPDESDRIISDLKHQLKSLQSELDSYRGAERAGQAGRPAAAPHDPVASERLRARPAGPAEELTQRLERLIAQIQDPELRRELEHCKQTAFYLFDTFRQISDNHRVLLESVTTDRSALAAAPFVRALEDDLAAFGHRTPVRLEGGGGEMRIVPESAFTVVRTLARVAGQLVGPVQRVHIARRPGSEADLDAEEVFCLTIACRSTREGLERARDPAHVVLKPGVSALTVVDWLYMEKIIELQDGALRLHHQGNRAAGFRIYFPAAPSGQSAED